MVMIISCGCDGQLKGIGLPLRPHRYFVIKCLPISASRFFKLALCSLLSVFVNSKKKMRHTLGRHKMVGLLSNGNEIYQAGKHC